MASLKCDYHNQFADAFHAAAADGKALLVFWSVGWCPPCNRLKAGIEDTGEDLLVGHDKIVTLYQDGDQPEAQQLAADWYLSGYPTLLLLKPDAPSSEEPLANGAAEAAVKKPVYKAKELYRLRGDLSGPELKQALALAAESLQPLEDMLNKDFAQFLTEHQWELLSFVDFLPFKEFLSSDAIIQIFKKLVAAVPSSLPTAKAQFSAYFLQYISERLSSMAPEYRQKVLPVVQDAIVHLGASQQTMYQTRSFLLEQAEPFIIALGKSFPSGTGDVAVTETAISLRAWAEHLYTEGQLSAAEAQTYLLNCAKLNGGRDKVDIEAIDKAAHADSEYSRNSSLSLLYSSLRHNGLEDPASIKDAEQLLKDQIKSGNNPAFYGWRLAYHYLDTGDYSASEQAIADAVDAAFSFAGEATQLQWLAIQFTLGLELEAKGHRLSDEALFAPVDRFIVLADSMPDGYLGRNYRQCFTIYREMAQHPHLKERSERYTDLSATLDARVEAASS